MPNAVAALVAKAKRFQPRSEEQPAGTLAPRFKLLTAEDIAATPPTRSLIKGVIPAECVGSIMGAPGSAKTFLATSALLAISEGVPWFGLRTHPAPALYVGLEGASGLANRVRALRTTGHDCAGMRFMSTSLDIRNELDRRQLIETIKTSGFGPLAIVIDTLARSTPGADENSGQDMGEIIAALADLQQQLCATVIAVHHVGKDSTKGPRGHSSLLAALDFAIEVRRDGDNREWQVVKAKDGEPPRLLRRLLRLR